MAGVRPLTEKEKKLVLLYGKHVKVYDILQAFSQDKVLNYDLEEHHPVEFFFYRSKSRMRGQRVGRKGRTFCKIFEKYSNNVPSDNISFCQARTHLSENSNDIQTITRPEIGQCSKAKGPRANGNEPQPLELDEEQ
ncbi:hypothetical protein Bca52824_009401 [Brassica carinata]|uniref:Uncharacterized protein n=1 Tax=Brassica carinata TaxID=52824 RepID=A0A8X7W9T5_BRACI|nr:hypothetical protein Bca52824_009401 [Brassica carinata]